MASENTKLKRRLDKWWKATRGQTSPWLAIGYYGNRPSLLTELAFYEGCEIGRWEGMRFIETKS